MSYTRHFPYAGARNGDDLRRWDVRVFVAINKARGYCIQVTQERFRGRERLDVREWYETRPGNPDTRRPTPNGISVGLNKIPALRAALEAAEKDALERGHLCEQDYRAAGVQPPAELVQRDDAQPPKR